MSWGNYAHFTREIQGKDLTVMTVDATILTAQSINQSVVSLRSFVNPFSAKILHDFIKNRETSSSRTAYPSLPHRCESSLAVSLLLSPKNLRFFGDPGERPMGGMRL